MSRIRVIIAALSVYAGLTIAPLGIAWAQTKTSSEATAPPARKAPPGFQPVAGAPDTEKIDASKLVIAAYATFFAGMFGYIVMVAKKQSDLAKEMEALANRINKAKP